MLLAESEWSRHLLNPPVAFKHLKLLRNWRNERYTPNAHHSEKTPTIFQLMFSASYRRGEDGERFPRVPGTLLRESKGAQANEFD